MPSSAGTRQAVPFFITDELMHRRAIAAWMREAHQGKLACTGNVTLATSASASSTTILDARIGAFSFIGFMPTTLNAASAMPALYVSSRSQGGAIVSHAINAAADKTYVYAILG